MEGNRRELGHMEDWENMLHFAIELILESKRYTGTGILGERIMILHLDHANELLMKSFLLKKGYVISYLDKNKAEKGVKKEEVIDNDKTLDYPECLSIASKEVKFSKEKQDKILRFHRLRNEIQHRATNLPLNKGEEIFNFYPYFKELYEKMFPDYAIAFPYLMD